MTSDETSQWFDAFLARRADWSAEENADYAELQANLLAIVKRGDERQAQIKRETRRRELEFKIERLEREKAATIARAAAERAALEAEMARA